MTTKTILNRTTKSRDRWTLLCDGRGMGGYGQPDNHYSRNWCVVNGVDRGYGYQGYMSIDAALEARYVPDEAKALIRSILRLEG